ncbi:hypothetical protein ACTTZI_004176 [Vibrio vulnificus]
MAKFFSFFSTKVTENKQTPRKRPKSSPRRKMSHSKRARRMSIKKQVKFFNNILALAKANMTQKEIATRLEEFGTKDEKAIGNACLDSLEKGGTFATGVEPWIEPMAWESLLAGEKVGNWAKGVENALKVLETSSSLGGALIMSFLKPIGMLVAGLGGLVGAKVAFFPKIMDLYSMNRWNDISKTAYSMGEWIQNYWLILVSAIVIAVVGTMLMISLLTGSIRDQLDKFPIFRHYRLILGANYMRSLGNLTMAGFGLKESLSSSRSAANRYQKVHIDRAIKTIGIGAKNIGDILDTGLLDPSERSTLKVLGEKGGYSQTLLDCADITQHKVKEELRLMIFFSTNIIMFIAAMFLFLLMGGVGILMFDLSTSM